MTSEEGIYVFRKSLKRNGLSKIIESFGDNSEQVCGLYLMTDPDKIIEVDVKFTDLSCEMENLVAVITSLISSLLRQIILFLLKSVF